MAFQVRFVYDPETHLIREIVESWVIELMRCTDSIDVVALHSQQVLFHEFIRNGTSTSRVMLMAIDSAEDHPLAIDLDEAILHLDLPETNALGNNLGTSGYDKMVEVW